MDTWRMTEPKIEGTVSEWIRSPSGDYVGMIRGDDDGVYIAGSKDCVNAADASQIRKGTRVRFTPETKGSGTDADTKAQYAWGVAREIVPHP